MAKLTDRQRKQIIAEYVAGDGRVSQQKLADKYHVSRQAIHDLRHSFVSMLIHLGANLMVVADLIGDTVEQVTKTYGHLYESDKREIISKL